MQYQFTIPSDGKVIELGGGSSPIIRPHCMGGAEGHINVDFRVCHTPSGERTVDFSCDLNVTPWTAIGSNEFDCAISRFCLEHVSYVQTLNFLLEVFRILRQGGKAAIIVPNTEEQLKWIQTNPNGWDGKNLFESASCILFGDQQHSAREGDQNVQSIDSHKAYFSPQILTELLQQAGFEKIVISSFGDRRTDLIAECIKPVLVEVSSKAAVPKSEVKEELAEFSCFPMSTFEERQKVFSRQYFDGGYPNNTGGYGHGGYSDFPIHEVTVRHILARKPESVLELGCARGYILKKLEDKGIRVAGIDISDHCHLLRVCDKTVVHDICRNSTWDKYIPGYYGNMGRLETINDQEFDLCVSVSLLEHIPEECVPTVVAEMSRTCKRGLHGVDFGRNPSRKDKTKCTLKPKEWWLERLPKGHEVVEKDELESGSLPPELLADSEGQLKIQFGCFRTMFYNGWLNTDVVDLKQEAGVFNFAFQQVDCRQGLPFNTGEASLLFAHHMLEHLSMSDAKAFLMECRRIIKPETGAMRIVVPDASALVYDYTSYELGLYDEMNLGCAEAKTQAAKLRALLWEGHQSIFDAETLLNLLDETGWVANESEFRKTKHEPIRQILKETIEFEYGGSSLFVDALPKIDRVFCRTANDR